MPSRQSGKLIELNIIGVVLAIAGLLLAAQHPGFFALTIVGLSLPFLPTALEVRESLRAATSARSHWKTLLDSGFTPAAMTRARLRDGGAILAVDSSTMRVAFVTGKGAETFPLADVKRLSTAQSTLYRWGELPQTRYGFGFAVGEGDRQVGLNFPRRRQAMRGFEALRRALDGRVAVDDSGLK